ncbi:MAG TPA: protease modulator HflC, partial [Allosphingosinicella sp.]
MSRALRNPIALAFIAIVLLVIAGSTFATVPETKQAVIVRFGNPDRVINAYRPGVDFGQTGAGLIARVPFMEQIVWIDKR